MNHPACERPGWQFIAVSGLKPRLHRASMRTFRLSCHDVAIHYFITTENIFYSLWSYNLFCLPTSGIELQCRHWLKPEERMQSGFTKQSTKQLKKLLKWSVWFLFVFIYAEVTGRIMEERTKGGNVMENKFFTFSVSQPPPVAPQNNTWPMHASGPWTLFKSIDVVFSDSANIVEHLPSGLSTPTKRLIRNGSLGTWLVITKPSHMSKLDKWTLFLGVGNASKLDSGA